MQQLRVRLWKEDRQERSEGNPELAVSGQRIPGSPPREISLLEHQPGKRGLGDGRVGEGQLRGWGLTEVLKMAALDANNIAHLPRETGGARDQRTGARATQRNHGETFSARADGGAQGQRLGALHTSAAQQPSGD